METAGAVSQPAAAVPLETFGAILQRMAEKRPGEKDAPDYLSTHPATRERIERARGAR